MNKQKERLQRTTENLSKIKQGDTVKIVNCFEADKNEGKTFKVVSEPYELCGSWCVWLENKGAWDIAKLEKIEVAQ